jgi:hypothetical protein
MEWTCPTMYTVVWQKPMRSDQQKGHGMDRDASAIRIAEPWESGVAFSSWVIEGIANTWSAGGM